MVIGFLVLSTKTFSLLSFPLFLLSSLFSIFLSPTPLHSVLCAQEQVSKEWLQEPVTSPSPRCTLRLPGCPFSCLCPWSYHCHFYPQTPALLDPSHRPGLHLTCCQRCRLCSWNTNHFFPLPWE